MLSCQEASRLVSQSLDRKLTLRQRIELKLHHVICSGCRAFARQLQYIRQTCRRTEDPDGIKLETARLTPAAKARILQEIADKQRGQPR